MQVKNTSLLNQQRKPTFSAAITGDALQGMIYKTIKDPRRAASFTSTLISVVGSNEKLKSCDPGSIVAAALRGEGMDLSLALGQYSIVPYGTTANYQLSYKGLSQLAMRSGMYADFDAFDVREGEYAGKNPRTRQPVINWIEDEDEREKKPLAGIYAFYELKNGFFKSIYWTHNKILEHANRYSNAFSKEKYDALLAGKLGKEEAIKLQSGSPWYGEPLSEAHLTMCKKTLLLRLLGDGKAPLSIEMRMAIDNEIAQEKSEGVIFADDPAVVAANQPKATPAQDTNVIDSTATEAVVEPAPAPKPAPTRQQKAPAKTAQRKQPEPVAKEPTPATGETEQLELHMNAPINTDGLPFN